MTDSIGPRLDRLGTLARSLNEVSDEIAKVVQGVEAHLSDTLHIGVRASVLIEHDEDESGTIGNDYCLVYDRYGPKFRFSIVYTCDVDGNKQGRTETLWANCPRDMKLLAFQKLPELLDALAVRMEEMLEQVDVGYNTIQDMIPVKRKAARS